ncbi:endonuclease/exonuclease/phosphatase family protein [Kitasatospora sp. NPDC094015]|uniref:endonuclease/exonuclease/phosphatase family protein n=1 Tax=Kitasatospora sp. NPDC094015 TaxID=3155205 RepID=UPI0033320451
MTAGTEAGTARTEHPEPAPGGGPRTARALRVALLVGCLALLTGPAALMLIRLTGADEDSPLAVPLAALPYATPVTLVAMAGLLALRNRWTAAVAGLLVLVQLWWLVPRFVPAGTDVPAAAPRLRVATSNAYLGRVDPAALVRLVREQRVDVLAVEELSPGAASALDRAGLGELMPYRAQPDGNDTVLRSRHPLTPLDPGDPAAARSMVGARVEVAGRTVRLVAVHTYYPLGDAAKWGRGFDGLRAAAGADTRDSVLLGDFNATVDHAPMRSLLATGLTDTHAELGRGGSPTWPVHNDDFPLLPPLIQIDHVLHGAALTAVDVSEHTLPGSDHRAVVAELALTG